jgi:hypothetical protein
MTSRSGNTEKADTECETKLDFLTFGWMELSCEAERPTDGVEK